MAMGESSVLALDLRGAEAIQAASFVGVREPVGRAVPFPVIPAAGARTVESRGRSVPAEWNVPSFDQIEVSFDREERILWQFMKPQLRPSFTMALLQDMRRFLAWVAQLCAQRDARGETPVRYMVLASKMPGIFNLGGDLPCFVSLIRAGDREGLRQYAHACIDVQHSRSAHVGLPAVTLSLVQGDALGGGFEAALADDVIIAERGAKLGLPEILFNLFPGMGAYSFLARRIDPVRAEKMILGGRVHTAEELLDMGIVDAVVDEGRGECAVYDHVERHRRAFHAHRSIFQARRMVNPVTKAELIGITDMWVDAAFHLGDADVRKMERLAAAQDRRWAAVSARG